MTEFIRNEPTLQKLIAFKQFKKGLVNSTLSLAARKNTALDKSVASQKGKDKTIIARATINLNEINGMTRKEIELNNDSSLISAIKNKISPTATQRTNIQNPYNKNTAAPKRKQQQHQNRTDTDSSDSNTATEQRNKRKHSTVTYGNNSRHRYKQDNRYRNNNNPDNFNYQHDDRNKSRSSGRGRGGVRRPR